LATLSSTIASPADAPSNLSDGTAPIIGLLRAATAGARSATTGASAATLANASATQIDLRAMISERGQFSCRGEYS